MRNRVNVRTAMIDVIMLLLLGFVALFILALIHINPIAAPPGAPLKEHFMIVLTWHNDSSSDVDLWLKTPMGLVGYPKRQGIIAFLDRDDLGTSNDTFVNENGETRTLHLNREVIFIKDRVDGEYIVNVHMYRKDKGDALKASIPKDLDITVEVVELIPSYRVIYHRKIEGGMAHSEELTVASFRIDKQKPPTFNPIDQFPFIKDVRTPSLVPRR